MPSTCAVATCKNNGKNTKGRGIILHSFPKNKVREQRWVYLCKREDCFNPKTSAVCSQHFSESDYERDLKSELLKIPSKRILKPSAEPRLKLPESFSVTNNENDYRKIHKLILIHILYLFPFSKILKYQNIRGYPIVS